MSHLIQKYWMAHLDIGWLVQAWSRLIEMAHLDNGWLIQAWGRLIEKLAIIFENISSWVVSFKKYWKAHSAIGWLI